MSRQKISRRPVISGITVAFVASLMAQLVWTVDVDRDQIQRLKDQLAVETRTAGDQFVRFFVPPPARSLNELDVDQLSAADLIRPLNAPQILSLDVKCGADNMQIQLKFDRPFNGIVYSKGYFSSKSCHHVAGGGGRTSRSFTIGADSCGTRFSRHEDGREYMENSIVIQNDAGLQKAFDSARKIRCMLRPHGARQVNEKVVSYAFNVDTLHQKEVTFETDEDVSKANAVLDIQIGQGPYAPSVDGLVKIGDILTMVVEAEGDNDVDVRVRQCIAMNGDRSSHVNLTDDVGCTMKPNLLSPWLKTRQEKAVMAYSYFSAFKFPEQMDVIIECNLDLCKGECGVCEEDVTAVSEALSRSRRSVNGSSSAAEQRTEAREPVRLARRLRVVAPQDIAITEATRTLLPHDTALDVRFDTVCVSVLTFVISLVVILLLLFVASITTAVLCVRARGQNTALVTTLPDSSFHAFSSISGKP
ncbi:hypothetical protein FJT64_027243 [Amphibalanus amphitrite]|uniref:ZP domain-containing protein n=1 Tax=Amphibalanus amphitrite TaxID=1232801 RepID=A0A6A4W4H5_AMPAM|nr:hypothetical protein FJT64_027243 [Amphibalanus amphitrite]